MTALMMVADKVVQTGDQLLSWFLGWPAYTLAVVTVAMIVQRTVTGMVRRTVRKGAAAPITRLLPRYAVQPTTATS